MYNKFYDDFIAVIQKDHIGNIIDIIKKEDDCARNEDDYVVLPLKEAIIYKKEHPYKNFFISKYTDEKVVDFLKENNCIQNYPLTHFILMSSRYKCVRG